MAGLAHRPTGNRHRRRLQGALKESLELSAAYIPLKVEQSANVGRAYHCFVGTPPVGRRHRRG